MRLRFTGSARRHKIGNAHVGYVVEHYRPMPTTSKRGEDALEWVADDDTGRNLHIVIVVVKPGIDPLDPEEGLVVHAMPSVFDPGLTRKKV